MTRRCGALVKVASKERMGREPRRQLPGKCSSDIVCTIDMLLAALAGGIDRESELPEAQGV